MPQGQIHVDAPLTNVSLAKKNAKAIMRRVLIECPVDHQSDLLYKYGDEIFISADDTRAPGTEAKPMNWKPTTVSFKCDGHAESHSIPREKGNNADPALNLMIDTTRILTARGTVNEEKNGVAAIAAALAATAVDCTNQRWDSKDVNPLLLIKQAIDTVTLAGGMAPNVLALSKPVMTAIRTNANTVALITGAPALANSRVTADQIAEWLELDEVLVGEMVYQTGPNAAKQFVWGQKALLFYRPSSPGLLENTFGYTMAWTKALAAVTGLESIPGMEGVGPKFVQTYFWEPEIADYVVVHNYYGQAIYTAEAALLWDNTLTGNI